MPDRPPQDLPATEDASANGAGSDPSNAKRGVSGIVFSVLFLDIVGFSILFPLFPRILEHYGTTGILASAIETLGPLVADDPDVRRARVEALFGGLLGSVYSMLQFVASPFWGRRSDRLGRRPVLLLTTTLTAVGHLLWCFSGSFAMFIVARCVAGAASGNISTATAAIADTTTGAKRAAGMGIVGAAFGIGMVFGPAIGALLGLSLEESRAASETGNPFIAASLIAFVFGVVNVALVAARFPETRDPRGSTETIKRTFNPVRLLTAAVPPVVRKINLAHFVFLFAFSGLEFTLVFLTRDRFGWGPKEQGMMFVAIGLTIALVQGGFIRRAAPKYGEKPLATSGLLLVAAGLVAIGMTVSFAGIVAGLAGLAVGSALVAPTVSSLVSRHSAEANQGLSLGIHRSVGALARAFGPIAAAVLYWTFGGDMPYLIGGLAISIPLVIIARTPAPSSGFGSSSEDRDADTPDRHRSDEPDSAS